GPVAAPRRDAARDARGPRGAARVAPVAGRPRRRLLAAARARLPALLRPGPPQPHHGLALVPCDCRGAVGGGRAPGSLSFATLAPGGAARAGGVPCWPASGGPGWEQ